MNSTLYAVLLALGVLISMSVALTLTNEGAGNYFPVARMNWYPNNPGSSFGEYASYDMTFRIPKGMQMAATGARVSDNNEGNQNVTVWKSEAPQTVAGFSFGRFKVEEAKLDKPEYFVQSFANQDSPDWVNSLQRAADPDQVPTGTSSAWIGATVAIGRQLRRMKLRTSGGDTP